MCSLVILIGHTIINMCNVSKIDRQTWVEKEGYFYFIHLNDRDYIEISKDEFNELKKILKPTILRGKK